MIDEKTLLQLLDNITSGCVGEDEKLEFKSAFSDWNKIAKTMAGMANNKGGIIIIGINDQRKINFLDENNIKKLDMQNSQFPDRIKDGFSPFIEWNMQIYTYKNNKIGILHISEHPLKPVISKKEYSDDGKITIKKGEIYYRYKAQTSTIEYAELVEIINQIKQREREALDRKWTELLEKISLHGVDYAGVLDGESGIIHGANHKFLLDEKLFQKLIKEFEFIKQGEFDEVKGSKTLKVVGDISVLENVESSITPNKAILARDSFITFLEQKTDIDPMEYIKTFCNESNKCPLFYYLYLSKKGKKEIEIFIDEIKIRKEVKKANTKQALQNHGVTGYIDLDFGRLEEPTDQQKRQLKQKKRLLKQKNLSEYTTEEKEKELFETVLTLKCEEIESIRAMLFAKIKAIFDENFTRKYYKNLASMKKAIIFLDEMLFKAKWQNDYALNS